MVKIMEMESCTNKARDIFLILFILQGEKDGYKGDTCYSLENFEIYIENLSGYVSNGLTF